MKIKRYISNGMGIFSYYYNRVTYTLDSLLQHDTTDYAPLITQSDSDRKASQKAINYYKELRDNGFELQDPEGMIGIFQDREFIKKEINPFLSKATQSYLNQQDLENREWFSSDAAILISEKEFLDRVLWWEKFDSLYPQFLFSADVKYQKKYYLYFLLEGMDNTYLFDDTLTPYFKNLYELAYEVPVETDFVRIIKEHYEIIKENGLKNSEKRREYLKKLQSEDVILSFD